jgi:dTDP-4-dehydrorhamnose reductase
MKPRVLVTGSGGLLGGRLTTLLARSHSLIGGFRESFPPGPIPRCPMDIQSYASMEAALAGAQPDVVVHAAALADADQCEREPDLAWRLNAGATEDLAQLCRERGIRLVLLSTDMVLSGDRSRAAEDDPAEPLGVYGKSKLAAEEAALSGAPGSAVLRVALVHGHGFGPRSTATEGVAWGLRAGKHLRLFTDQYRTPVDPESVADAVARVVARGATGRFHIGGPERLSRYALGLRVRGLLAIRTGTLEGIPQAAGGLSAPRPLDASMDSGRAQRELEWQPRPIDEGIRDGRPGPG